MKKILHVSNYYFPHIGGIEDVCRSIITDISLFRHQIICFNDKPITERTYIEGIEITRCSVWLKLFSQSISFSLFWKMKEIIENFKPDIIHFHAPNPLSSVALLLLLPYKVKVIVHWHSDIVQNCLYIFYKPIERQLLHRADKIVVTSWAYFFGSKVLLRWKNKIRMIPNVVNVSKLQLKDEDIKQIEKIKGRYGNKKIVFAFGRHVAYKGFSCLVEASSLLLDETIVIIAGSGIMSKQLRNMPSSSSLCFIGHLTDDELRQYLYVADIFAFPSITRNEAFGIALAEAMYCGLPSVVFTIFGSGVNWVSIHGETGLEVENGNVQAFASTINQLLKDFALRKKLGLNASRRIRELFIIEAIRKDLIQLYEL